MKFRSRISKSGSKRLFRATAVKTHKLNLNAMSSRGGIRL